MSFLLCALVIVFKHCIKLFPLQLIVLFIFFLSRPVWLLLCGRLLPWPPFGFQILYKMKLSDFVFCVYCKGAPDNINVLGFGFVFVSKILNSKPKSIINSHPTSARDIYIFLFYISRPSSQLFLGAFVFALSLTRF